MDFITYYVVTRGSYGSVSQEVSDRYYVFIRLLTKGFDRYGHTKSDSESDRMYGSFQCGRFVQCSCTESHFCNFTHMEKLKCMFMHYLKPHFVSN